MAPDVISRVKVRIKKLLETIFIRTTKYVTWLSNIVPAIKKKGKLRVCIDFRNLNNATTKGMYPIPVVKMLLDSTTGNAS